MSNDLMSTIGKFIDNCPSNNLKLLEKISTFLKEKSIVLREQEIEILIMHSEKLARNLDLIIKHNKEAIEKNEIFNITNDYNSLIILESYCNLKGLTNDNCLEKTTSQKLLTLEEEQNLFARFHNGDNEAKITLINYNKRLIYFVAKKYINLGVEMDDLVQEGMEGLLKAINYYDYKRGFKFSTYAMYWIKQTILKSIQSYSRLIKVPIGQANKLLEYNKANFKLGNTLGYNPSRQELADYMNVSIEEIKKYEKLSYSIISLDKNFGEDEGLTLKDVIADPVNPFMELEEKMIHEKIIVSLRDLLSEKSFLVVALRNGLYNENPKTLEEVGAIFGVSRERIRQIEIKALHLIKKDATIISALTKTDYKGKPQKSTKSIFQLLNGFSVNAIVKAINSLDIEEQKIIHDRFGKNLDETNEVSDNVLITIYNVILPKLERIMGFKLIKEDTLILPSKFKSLPELFSNYSEEQIREGIAALNIRQQQLLKNRYGESLTENRPITLKDKNTIYSNIIPKIKAYLKKKYEKKEEHKFKIPEEIILTKQVESKLLEVINTDYFEPIIEKYDIYSAIVIAFSYGHLGNQFLDFKTIASLLNTTPEHIKAILNIYLNNIDKINIEGKALQKKRRD